MTEPTASALGSPGDKPESDSADTRMAGILRGEVAPRPGLRDSLRDEATPDSDDILGRLNALDFVDTLVGEAADMPVSLGDYKIRGLLGRGGMGTVYDAFQQSLERDVALKVLSPAFSADVTMRERFRSEARATASLHHEHIVPVYDFGEAGGVLYFAMEKVNGVSLDTHIAAARRLDRPALEPLDAAAKFAGVAEALHHAHRRRILHRDVKPGNLLVAPDGTIALADFGLSKIVGEASRSLTAVGAFLGTPSYAPPEQARGAEPSPASDLYALGVTIFEAVTGELPLSGKTTEALLDAILNGVPKRLRALRPKAPKDLDAVIHKLLQKEPTDRYTDGEELARDLRRIAEGEPVRIRRQPVWQLVWRKAKKNPGLTSTIGVAVALGILTLVLAVLNTKERSRSVEARHENHLQQAISVASRQSGSVQGPPGLFAALTGIEPNYSNPSDQVLRELAEADRLVPDDKEQVSELRTAYLEDPLSAATELATQGAGYKALALLDPVIDEARQKFELRDEATLLRLYRLYLMRAVTRLMGSVAELDQARMDLFAASFIRSGAFFPRLLLKFVDWDSELGAAPLIESVRGLLVDAPEGSAVVAGILMDAFAGLRRAKACNLVQLPIRFAVRRALHDEARRLLGERSDDFEVDSANLWTGRENVVAAKARAAARVFGQSLICDPLLREGQAILDAEIGPESPMRSWQLVLDLIGEEGRYDESTYFAASELPKELKVRGCIDLIRLDPPRGLMNLLGVGIREFLEQNRDAPGAAELAAHLARVSGEPDEVLAAAAAWFRAEPDHPGALLCRFSGLVRSGSVFEANVCAATLIQRSADRQHALGEILEILRKAERVGDESSLGWQELRQKYERYSSE